MKAIITLMLMVMVFSSCQHGASHGAKFPWEAYSKKAVLDSVALHKPVVIDFFAEWCPNCHELDRAVFSLPQVQALLAHTTALRMDVTDQDDAQVQKIIQEYNVDGVPTVIFLDSKGQEINNSRVIGFVSPEEFFRSLALLKIFK